MTRKFSLPCDDTASIYLDIAKKMRIVFMYKSELLYAYNCVVGMVYDMVKIYCQVIYKKALTNLQLQNVHMHDIYCIHQQNEAKVCDISFFDALVPCS